MNLYLCSTKKFKYYVIAKDPTMARDIIEALLNIADFGSKNDRDVITIELLAKELTYFLEDTPNFSSGNNLIISENILKKFGPIIKYNNN